MLEAEISFFMNQINKLPYEVSDHYHDCYEIVYYISGTGVGTINEVEFHYSPGSFCIIPPMTNHRERATAETEIMYAGFNYDNSLGILPPCLLEDGEQEAVALRLKQIKHEMNQRNPFYVDALSLNTRYLVLEVLRILKPSASIDATAISKPFEYIVNYINSNFAHNIDIKFLAATLNYSYDRFRHLFKELYDISPKQYIINCRINHAKLLMQNTTKPIKEIADLCGFSSAPHFVTTFRNTVGVTPAEYRKNVSSYKEVATFIE